MINPLKNTSKAFKASFAFFLSSIITKGIAYITTPFFTRLLTTEEYGQVSVYLTWMQIFGIIAMFCLSYGVFNNGMIDYPDKRDEYSFSMLILSNLITIAFSGLLLCIYPFVQPIIGLDYALILLMCIIFLLQPAYNFWTARQRYEYKYKAVFIVSISSALLSTIVALLCMVNADSGKRLYPRLFGAEITLILFYFFFYIYLGSRSHWRVKKEYWKGALLFNLPLIPHYLSSYLLNSSDKVMISVLVGDSETAFYSVAYSVAAIATIVWTAINSSLIPFTYEKLKKEKYKEINKVVLPLLTLFALCSICIIMLAPEVVKFMATKEYLEAIYVIPPIVGGVFFQVQYYVYSNVLYYYKKPSYVMLGSITAVGFNIVLNYIFINKYGYLAAGYTTLICYLIQAFIDGWALQKVLSKKIYNMHYIVILSAIVVCIAIGSNFIYKYMIVRYAVLTATLCIWFIFRKKILQLFVSIKKKT